MSKHVKVYVEGTGWEYYWNANAFYIQDGHLILQNVDGTSLYHQKIETVAAVPPGRWNEVGIVERDDNDPVPV